MKHYIVFLLSLIAIYVYIYAPPLQFVPFGLDKLILCFSILYVTFRKRWCQFYKYFSKELILLFFIVVCSLFIHIIHREDSILLKYDVLLLLEVFICPYALFISFEEKNKVHLDQVLIVTAIIASIVSIFLLLNPQIAYDIKNNVLKFPENLIDKFIYRGYGISDGLLFSYPVILGFCASFLLLGFYENRFNIIFILFFFLSILANARSGLVPIFVGLLVLLLFDVKRFIRISFFLGVIVFVFSGLIMVFMSNNVIVDVAFHWGMSTFDILGDFLAGEQGENVEVLLNDMVVWPTAFHEYIVGSGRYLFTGYEVNTDIGYFLRLNYGGILYLLSWLQLLIFMFRRLFSLNKSVTLLLFISLLYLNYKSDFFVVNPASRFFFMVYVLCVLNIKSFSCQKTLSE